MTEITSELITATCEKYVSLVGDEDIDALMALFADDCAVEDPVGSDVREGREAVRELYATLPAMDVSCELVGPVHAVPDGRAAAFPFKIHTGEMVVDVIDVMTFDDDGKIATMTAYWRM